MSTKKKTHQNRSAVALKERPESAGKSGGFVPRGASDAAKQIDDRRKAREAAKGPKKAPLSIRAHDRFGPRGVKAIHLGLAGLARLAVAAIGYVLVSFSVTTGVPLLGVLMVGVSGVADDSGTMSILATWLAPLIFLVIVMTIVEWLLMKALWNFAVRSTKQMGRNLGAIDDNASSKEN